MITSAGTVKGHEHEDSVEVRFDNVDNNGVLQLLSKSNAEISGTIRNLRSYDYEENEEPDVAVRLQSPDNEIRIEKEPEVSEDGLFSVTVDVSSSEIGKTFTTSVRVDGAEADAIDSEIVGELEGTTTGDSGNDTTESTDGAPGFGVTAAITSLGGAGYFLQQRLSNSESNRQ